MSGLSDDAVAAIYDLTDPWDPVRSAADAFYTDLVMGARDVLDVGCGTGSMLHDARRRGHRGRLAGIDPDAAARERARVRQDIEWFAGTAADIAAIEAFELATMTSHAFQFLVTDDEISRSLRAIHSALREGGRFAFETRHPQARAWEQWAAAEPSRIQFRGRTLLRSYEIASVDGDVVHVIEVTAHDDGTILRRDETAMRFLDPARLSDFLSEAGFEIETQYGAWDRSPVDTSSTEIITMALRT